MKWTIGRKLMAGFMGLVVLLLLMSIVSYYNLAGESAVCKTHDRMLLS